MREFLSWPPVLWVGRLALLGLAVGTLYLTALYLARFLRPRHIRELLRADLPKFKRVGGTAKVLGQELSLQGELDDRRSREVDLLDSRLKAVERQLAEVVAAVELLSLPRSGNGKSLS